MKCSECRFFQPSTSNVSTQGSCRKYTPVVIVVGEFREATQHWPKVYPGDWCGEFQPTITQDMEDEAKEWASDDVGSVVDQRDGRRRKSATAARSA